ncbi:MAG: Rieske 2Fe-2S domain-containing protein [Gammaproteobacteria bacterium]|nr:Rieske 2Fe-2S domain-containing protein [Gammaproteobacteria bacterium]
MEPLAEDNNESPLEILIGGMVYKVPRYCPHRRGKLQYGFVNERKKTIACPLHRSTFSLETGEQISGPPCGRLDVKKCAK